MTRRRDPDSWMVVRLPAGLDLGTFRQVRASSMRYIRPLMEAVPPSTRAIMDGFVEAGCAPSPFLCVAREGA